MQFSRALMAILIVLVAIPVFAQSTLNQPLTEPVPYRVVSDLLANPFSESRALHEEVIRIDDAAWLRVYFGDQIALGEGSLLRITSELDGEVQELDAAGLETWRFSTAYFNGDTVRVELIGGPQTQDNRLAIDRLAWETAPEIPIGSCGICGPDDRVQSNEDFAARLLPAGCSSTVYNTDSCLVTAGHCIDPGMIVQFRVPLSNSNCTLNHPPVNDQFPIDDFAFTNAGIGNDWGVLAAGTNNLGETPYERFGAKKPLATTPPDVGQSLTIWGYGVDSECIFSQAQQTSDGDVVSVNSTFFGHTVDATYGNSGSSLQRNGAEILGIATHCPCPGSATRIDHPSFAAARDQVCPEAAPLATTLISATVTHGTPVTTELGLLQASDNNYFVVDSVTQGPRNNALTVMLLQSPVTTVSDITLSVEYGPVGVDPVFYSLQIFNYETGLYEILEFGILSLSSDSVISINGMNGADDYVNDVGEILLRVAATARAPQTPAGYTKLVDHVEVFVAE